ncbi:hypothetical protein SK128_027923, partial [Halocaridina rubra]
PHALKRKRMEKMRGSAAKNVVGADQLFPVHPTALPPSPTILSSCVARGLKIRSP